MCREISGQRRPNPPSRIDWAAHSRSPEASGEDHSLAGRRRNVPWPCVFRASTTALAAFWSGPIWKKTPLMLAAGSPSGRVNRNPLVPPLQSVSVWHGCTISNRSKKDAAAPRQEPGGQARIFFGDATLPSRASLENATMASRLQQPGRATGPFSV